MKNLITIVACLSIVCFVAVTVAQRPGGRPADSFGFGWGPPPGGPRGGGPGGPGQQERKLLDEFDSDNSGWLDQKERALAREAAKSSGEHGRGGPGRGSPGRGPSGGGFRDRGPGGRGPGGQTMESPKPGRTLSPNDVESFADASLYDTSTLRTLFLELENSDWESELEDFHGTDVEVPAKLTVDGQTYDGVGVRFRGASSYGHVASGQKRSLNLSMDLVDHDQRLAGYKTLNLLNAHGDASLMSTVLYSRIANEYLATPHANFVHVVINGESWGVYTNVQQFDKTFLKESFGASKGTRWKVSGSPNADGGLRYLGEEIEPYRARFEMKSNDGEKAWRALIELCRVLNQTPSDRLVEKLVPILDIDGALAFLALDVALVNMDGYWTRASDYSIFRDGDGKFHLIPHDMNEAFQTARRGPAGPGGPGGPAGPGGRGGPEGRSPHNDFERQMAEFFGFGPPGGPGPGGLKGPGGRGPGGPGHGGGVDLDPMTGLDDERLPLRSKLLAVPELKAKYDSLVQQIAGKSLDWESIGPFISQQRELIADEVALDTRKLTSTAAFIKATDPAEPREGTLKGFLVGRRDFLLKANSVAE